VKTRWKKSGSWPGDRSRWRSRCFSGRFWSDLCNLARGAVEILWTFGCNGVIGTCSRMDLDPVSGFQLGACVPSLKPRGFILTIIVSFDWRPASHTTCNDTSHNSRSSQSGVRPRPVASAAFAGCRGHNMRALRSEAVLTLRLCIWGLRNGVTP
jgi:hypothetical protein